MKFKSKGANEAHARRMRGAQQNTGVLRRFLQLLVLLLLAGMIAAGWYAYDKGFTKKWRGFVVDEFQKRGVEISLRRLTLEPWRGIVARDVRIYDDRERKRTLAVVNEIRLVINYANLVRGEPFLEALDLRDASLALPLNPKKPRGSRIEVRRLSGRLLLPPQQIYLSWLEAEIYGVRLTASGRFINPEALSFAPDAKAGSAFAAVAERTIQELKSLAFDATPPQLDVRFSGDLAQRGKIAVDLTLWAERVRRGSFNLRDFYVSATLREGTLTVRQLSASDAQGTARLSGEYRIEPKQAELHLESTLDLQAAAKEFQIVPQLAEVVFYAPPHVTLSGRAGFGDAVSISLLGRVELGRFALRSVPFESLVADGSWDGERWSARDIRLVHRTGEVTGDVLQIPGQFRSRLHSTINPKALAPLLSGKAAEWFAQFEFTDAPVISAEAAGPRPDFRLCAASADVKVGRASYRAVPAESLTASLRYVDRRLVVEPFRVERAEGTGSGALTFDFATNEVHLHAIRSTVQPAEAALWIEPKLVKDIMPYRFPRQPPELLIDGVVHTKGGDTTRLTIDVEAPKGLDYTFLKRNLSFPHARGQLVFTDDHLRIRDLSAALFGGWLKGDASISLERQKPGHAVELRLDDVDFASLTRLYFNYDTSKGKLSGFYNFSGRGEDARTMRGHGELQVHDGQVFAIPFLGPLSGILNSIVPGMGHDVARNASAAFSIDEGVITTENMVVNGNGFRMLGNGRLMFLDDRIDFSVRINARGIPGVLLFPVSKLFEYVADDKLSKPRWRPKALPRL